MSSKWLPDSPTTTSSPKVSPSGQPRKTGGPAPAKPRDRRSQHMAWEPPSIAKVSTASMLPLASTAVAMRARAPSSKTKRAGTSVLGRPAKPSRSRKRTFHPHERFDQHGCRRRENPRCDLRGTAGHARREVSDVRDVIYTLTTLLDSCIGDLKRIEEMMN